MVLAQERRDTIRRDLGVLAGPFANQTLRQLNSGLRVRLAELGPLRPPAEGTAS